MQAHAYATALEVIYSDARTLRTLTLRLVSRCSPVRVVCSDVDPFCSEGAVNWLAPEDFDLIPGGGHLALFDGYGNWPSLLQWCEEPQTRIVGR